MKESLRLPYPQRALASRSSQPTLSEPFQKHRQVSPAAIGDRRSIQRSASLHWQMSAACFPARTDCLSFVVMRDEGISQALTGDRNFEQAGFTALLK